jgi:hypothetical protein
MNFPTAGDLFNASGYSAPLTSGGTTPDMYAAGDSLQSPIFSVPIGPITGLTEDWYYSAMLNGSNAIWDILLNGTLIGTATMPDQGSYNTETHHLTDVLTFAPVAPIAGQYQLQLVLESDVVSGSGSVAWKDGGTTTLSDVPGPDPGQAPEPGSLGALGVACLAGLGWFRRQRSNS